MVGFELFSLTLFAFEGGVFLTFETKPASFATDCGNPTDDSVYVFRFFNGRGKICANKSTAVLEIANGPSGDGIAMGSDDTFIDTIFIFGDKTRVPG